MSSCHAASIIASCVRTEYAPHSVAQDTPRRSPRIRRPDRETSVDRRRLSIFSRSIQTDPRTEGRQAREISFVDLSEQKEQSVVRISSYSSSATGVHDLSGLKRSILPNSSRVFGPKSLS